MSLADELLADLEENDAPEEEIMDTTSPPDDDDIFVKPAIPVKKLEHGTYLCASCDVYSLGRHTWDIHKIYPI